MNKSNVATATICFFSAGSTINTKSLIESVISGKAPSFIGIKTDENSWMKKNGYSVTEYTGVSFPQAGYAAIEATDKQVDEMTKWLDIVAPEWRSATDGYGNKSVQIIGSLAKDPLENLISPESRGDYI